MKYNFISLPHVWFLSMTGTAHINRIITNTHISRNTQMFSHKVAVKKHPVLMETAMA